METRNDNTLSSWDRYEMLVLERLARLEDADKDQSSKLEQILVEITKLKVRADLRTLLIGSIAGTLPAVVIAVYFLLGNIGG